MTTCVYFVLLKREEDAGEWTKWTCFMDHPSLKTAKTKQSRCFTVGVFSSAPSVGYSGLV